MCELYIGNLWKNYLLFFMVFIKIFFLFFYYYLGWKFCWIFVITHGTDKKHWIQALISIIILIKANWGKIREKQIIKIKSWRSCTFDFNKYRIYTTWEKLLTFKPSLWNGQALLETYFRWNDHCVSSKRLLLLTDQV